jgi:hypothetical protein
VVAPSSGCLLHADIWVVPIGARGGSRGIGPSPLLPSWLEFGLAPTRSLQHSGLKSGTSPVYQVMQITQVLELAFTYFLSGAAPLILPELDKSVRKARSSGQGLEPNDTHNRHKVNYDNGFLPSTQILEKSEFLFPLDGASTSLYNQMLKV